MSKKCMQCKVEYDLSEFARTNKHCEVYTSTRCHKCSLKNEINKKERIKIVGANKRRLKLEEGIKEGKIKKCNKCNRNRNVKYFISSDTICESCLKFIRKEMITIAHEQERKDMAKEAYKFKIMASQAEKAEKANATKSMIENFINQKGSK